MEEWKKGAEALRGFCAEWAGPTSSHSIKAARPERRKAQRLSLGARVAGRNRKGSACPGRPTGVRSPYPPEGTQTRCGGERRADVTQRCAVPSLPRAGQPASQQPQH